MRLIVGERFKEEARRRPRSQGFVAPPSAGEHGGAGGRHRLRRRDSRNSGLEIGDGEGVHGRDREVFSL